jgi:triacylglycerol lipase
MPDAARLPRPLRHAVWFVEDWIYALVWQLRSLGPRGAADYVDGDLAPVVILPGIWETWHFLRPLIEPLHARGHPVHVVPSLRFNGRPVVDSARTVAGVIAELDLRHVVLVTHSKGGLIGKYVMTLLDPERRVDRMISVNAPFGGSLYARFAPLPSLRAFSRTDPTLHLLAQDVAANTRITSIFGEFDSVIPEGSELAGAHNVRLANGGHFRILADPRTIATVLTAAAAAEERSESDGTSATG